MDGVVAWQVNMYRKLFKSARLLGCLASRAHTLELRHIPPSQLAEPDEVEVCSRLSF